MQEKIAELRQQLILYSPILASRLESLSLEKNKTAYILRPVNLLKGSVLPR